MNKHVSFKLAELLVKQGISIQCENCYVMFCPDRPYPYHLVKEGEVIPAPTIADVVAHLHEQYGLWVAVDNLIDGMFYFSTRNTRSTEYASREGCDKNGYGTSTEAAEAAITHIITKLI